MDIEYWESIYIYIIRSPERVRQNEILSTALETPMRPRYETLLTPTRPETRNPGSMYKNKVNTIRVQTRDPRVTAVFVYANN